MERLDKLICSQTKYSRRDVKELVRNRKVLVNGEIAKNSDIKVNPNSDSITINNVPLQIKKNIYLMLNKPKGYVSANDDKRFPTVIDLVPEEYSHRDLFPAGRLDKDTTGLMIITDDGNFAHNILSPSKHVSKTYKVTIDIPLTDEMVIKFKEGIKLNDGVCKPSLLEIVDKYTAKVVLTEGRYHQIKRMFGCFGAKVIELDRIAMGKFLLPSDLEQGQCREFTKEELAKVTLK